MKEIRKVTVMGAGVMGPGIAQIMTLTGADVALYDIVPEALEKAKTALHDNYLTFVKEGLLKQDQVEPLFAKVSYTTDLAQAVQDTDLVFEVVAERENIKRSVYQQLDELLPQGVIIASNTSAMNIFEIMPERRLADTVIAHWYAPANVIPLVEVVGNSQTEPEVVETIMDLLRRGGKTPVFMKKFIQGYIVNRLQQCLNREVFYLLDNDYCTPQDIDLAVKNSFIPRACVLGLCKRMDFGGLDMTANNYRNHSYHMPEHGDEMPRVLAEHIARGELGVKTGKGFYDYTQEDIEALRAKRDHQLFEIFREERALMEDPV
ncbi:MAG: 3-hydroxyacyl-CoA dehydrogenase family protein [Oscillospiraceae bacterium]|nr:3-hydroxyacyl-CoA dehydrogenase family protein [Oscillospiraceae bacterium]